MKVESDLSHYKTKNAAGVYTLKFTKMVDLAC